MRRSILLCLTLLISVAAMGRTPWLELSPQQQREVLASRRTPDVVRKVMNDECKLSAIDGATRAALMQEVTSRTSDPNLAALYLYLYDLLRDPSGGNGRQDVRMLSLYAPEYLELWSSAEDRGSIYSYAYSVGRRRAIYGKLSGGGALKKLSKKRYAESYGRVIAAFNSAVELAYDSELAGRRAFEDVTPPVQTENIFLITSAEEYAGVQGVLNPLVPMLGEPKNDIEAAMRRECMLSGRAYHCSVKQSLGRGIELVQSLTHEGEYLTFIDASSDSYSVENEVYRLNADKFVVVERGAEPQSIMLGRITQRGYVDIIGRVYVDMGRKLLGVKCTESMLYIHVSRASSEEYLKLPLI